MATQRQKKLAKAIVENAVAEKPKTAQALLENVGYATNTAEVKSKEIIESKGVQDEIKTLAAQIPDDLLVERHLELLNKREVYKIGHGEDTEYEMSDQPETAAVSKGLEMAYKLKGSYAPEKSLTLNVSVIDDEAISKIADELNAKMTNEVHEGNGFGGNGEIPSVVVEEVRDENGEGTSIRV